MVALGLCFHRFAGQTEGRDAPYVSRVSLQKLHEFLNAQSCRAYQCSQRTDR
jgi:hypothetical protein